MQVLSPLNRRPVRVALWGCGHVGGQLAEGIVDGYGGNVTLCAVWGRTKSDQLLKIAASLEARPCTDLDAVLATSPELMVQASTAASLAEFGPRILEAGVDLIALSPACLCDPVVEDQFRQVTQATGRRLWIPSGSADGIEWLLATRHDKLGSVHLTVTWPSTDEFPEYSGSGEPQEVFAGTARQAAKAFPHMLNFVVAIGLAGLGLDKTSVLVQIDPTVHNICYRLEAKAWATDFRTEVVLRRPDNRRGRLASLSGLAALRLLSVR